MASIAPESSTAKIPILHVVSPRSERRASAWIFMYILPRVASNMRVYLRSTWCTRSISSGLSFSTGRLLKKRKMYDDYHDSHHQDLLFLRNICSPGRVDCFFPRAAHS